jgi:hypothetical protein
LLLPALLRSPHIALRIGAPGLLVIPTTLGAQANVELISCGSTSVVATLQASDFHGPRLLHLHDSPLRLQRLKLVLASLYVATWTVVKHVEVGGVTSHTSVFCNVNCSAGTARPAVAQSLATVIDYKICLPPATNDDSLLTLDSLLPTNQPMAMIRMPSRFSSTGHGARPLSPKELFLAWDVPLWAIPLSPQQAELKLIPPLKALLAQADATVTALALPSRALGNSPLAPLPVPPCPLARE